jgi:hypothetical protein
MSTFLNRSKFSEHTKPQIHAWYLMTFVHLCQYYIQHNGNVIRAAYVWGHWGWTMGITHYTDVHAAELITMWFLTGYNPLKLHITAYPISVCWVQTFKLDFILIPRVYTRITFWQFVSSCVGTKLIKLVKMCFAFWMKLVGRKFVAILGLWRKRGGREELTAVCLD